MLDPFHSVISSSDLSHINRVRVWIRQFLCHGIAGQTLVPPCLYIAVYWSNTRRLVSDFYKSGHRILRCVADQMTCTDMCPLFTGLVAYWSNTRVAFQWSVEGSSWPGQILLTVQTRWSTVSPGHVYTVM